MRLPTEFHRTRSVIAFDLRPLAGVPLPAGFVDSLPFGARRVLGRLRPHLRRWQAAVTTAFADWRRRRNVAAAYRELRMLDARTLRDLGLHDSELMSVVTEIHGDADPTRLRTFQALRGLE